MPNATALRELIEKLSLEQEVHPLLYQGHLFARIHPPGAGDESERCEFDQATQTLTHFLDGAAITWADAEMVGSFRTADNVWVWSEQRDFRSSLRERFGSLCEDKLSIDDADANLLAQCVARDAGFFSVYPVIRSETILFAALRVRMNAETESAPRDERSLWCSGCGLAANQVSHLAKGVAGSLCLPCAEQAHFVRMMAGKDLGDLEREPVEEEMPACVLSGDKIPRIYLPYVAVGWSCIEMILEAVEKQGTDPANPEREVH